MPPRFRVLLVAPLLAPLVSAQELQAPDPLDRVEPYTLKLEHGLPRPLDNYFYLGFVHGLPHQAVHLGFNGRQSTSRGTGVYRGGDIAAPGVYRDAHGLRYYSLAWAADSLAQAINAARDRAAKKLSLNDADRRLVELPDAIKADGKPYANRARLNLFDPATRELLLGYVRAHVRAWSAATDHHATGPLIHYWGLDNEWEGNPDYSPEARAAFAAWLRDQYAGDIAALNEAWTTGTDLKPAAKLPFATFEAAVRDQLPAPADYAKRPGAWLDWTTFQSRHFTTFLAELGRAMHEADPLRRGVVHKSTQQTIEMPGVNRTHTFDHELFAELMRPISGGLLATDMYGSGDRQAYEINYIYNAIRPLDGAPGFGVFLPETNNHNGPGHAFAATAWRMLPNGLKAVDFFTLGFAGAQNDWDKFGFIDPATGAPKDKLFYAARWAHVVHRAEDFWKTSAPAAGLPRVALLLPRRDVLLSDLSARSTSRWGYPRNHRWLVYRWLREQGYWVDVIPSTKLDATHLRDRYQALFLVGAEHLSATETEAVSGFVREGGLLVADARPGHFDEHHRARPARLAPLLGLELRTAAPAATVDKKTIIATGHSDEVLLADGRIEASTTTARVVTRDKSGRPIVWTNSENTGEGRVLYLGFELGSSLLRKPADAMAAFLLDGPTADIEEYARQQGELAIGRWLGDLVRRAGVAPAVSADAALADTGNLRVEQPVADAAGNVAVVIASRADSVPGPLPAGEITLPLPGGPWRAGFWAPAEHDGLIEIALEPIADAASAAGLHRVKLPAIPTVGVLHLFKEHAPVLSIPAIAGAAEASDGHTARLAPGKPVSLVVELLNPSAAPLAAGTLAVKALAGWTLEPAELATPELAPGARHSVTVRVTPPADVGVLKPDWIYPLLATWGDSARPRRAVLTANVQLDVTPAEAALLLTDNAHVPDTYPYRQKTGATYRYEATLPQQAAIADPAKPAKNTPENTALTNGFNSRLGWRTTGSGASAYSAAYSAPGVAPIFDLQAPRQVRRIVVNAGPGNLMPARLVVSTSVDNREWTEPASLALSPEDPAVREFTVLLPADAPRARYVKVGVEWPSAGGTLDEIEIWGR